MIIDVDHRRELPLLNEAMRVSTVSSQFGEDPSRSIDFPKKIKTELKEEVKYKIDARYKGKANSEEMANKIREEFYRMFTKLWGTEFNVAKIYQNFDTEDIESN